MADPDTEKVKALVLEGFCPFCGKGPFRVLAGHTYRIHDTDRRQLRDLIGVYYSTSICDPEYSEQRRLQSLEQYRTGKTGITAVWVGPKRFSVAATQQNTARMRKVSDQTRAQNGRRAAARHYATVKDRDDLITNLITTTRRTYKGIAALLSVNPVTVSRTAQRRHLLSDGRARWAAGGIPATCGTEAGFQKHKRHGETPCQACREGRQTARRLAYHQKKVTGTA